ncbi:MAG: MFS transporter [Pseudomonadota bacterium]
MTSDATPQTSSTRMTRAIARIIASIGVTNVALYVVYMGVLQLLLPHQLSLIDASDKVSLFGIVTGIGATAATVANPIAGALSDRTHTKFGRRTPWIVSVALIATPMLMLLGAMQTIIGVTIGWCLVQIVMNCFQASFAAVLPERVPMDQRGVASAALGVGVPVGIIIGTLIGKRLLDNLPLAYGALGAVFAVVVFAFVALNPEGSLAPRTAQPKTSFADFFSALGDADFRWTFISRFLINLNYCATTTFHLYLLQDYAKLHPGQTAEAALVVVNGAGMTSMIISTFFFGWVSDLAHRRKIFVSGSALALVASALVPIIWPTFDGMLAFAICNGLGMGCYLAVDTAVATQVLPDEKSQARDLGVFNIASAGPQIVGPFAASMIVAHLGGYVAMLIYGGAMAALSAFTILKVRKVR